MSRGGAGAQQGFIYHFIARFVAKEWFIQSTNQRRTYLSLLGSKISRSDWQCFSYAVMSSHIHLGLVAGASPLADWLRHVHEDFARSINERRERIGAVFVRGPEMIEFRPEGVPALINYIHCNPVRAGVVAHPSESDWTSHRAYLGLAAPQPWLNIDLGLALGRFENGAALGAWMDQVQIGREELDKMRVKPRRRGRPPKARAA